MTTQNLGEGMQLSLVFPCYGHCLQLSSFTCHCRRAISVAAGGLPETMESQQEKKAYKMEGGGNYPPKIFGCRKNLGDNILSENFRPKMQNFALN